MFFFKFWRIPCCVFCMCMVWLASYPLDHMYQQDTRAAQYSACVSCWSGFLLCCCATPHILLVCHIVVLPWCPVTADGCMCVANMFCWSSACGRCCCSSGPCSACLVFYVTRAAPLWCPAIWCPASLVSSLQLACCSGVLLLSCPTTLVSCCFLCLPPEQSCCLVFSWNEGLTKVT